MTKDLKYFMRAVEPEVVTVPGLDSIKDDDGNVIPFEIKVLSQDEITKINDSYKRKVIATDKRGNPIVSNGEIVWKIERDAARAARHIIVEALQFPDLKDKELMSYYGCVDVTEMPTKVFPRTDEFAYVSKMVMKVLGIYTDLDDEEEFEAAKN